jgi:hypothetical protein
VLLDFYDKMALGGRNFRDALSDGVSQIRLRGGTSSYSSNWGLRQVKASEAILAPGTQDTECFGYPIANLE